MKHSQASPLVVSLQKLSSQKKSFKDSLLFSPPAWFPSIPHNHFSACPPLKFGFITAAHHVSWCPLTWAGVRLYAWKCHCVPPLSRGPDNAVFLCLSPQQSPFPQRSSFQLATALQPQHANFMRAPKMHGYLVTQPDAQGCLSQIACMRLLSKMLCLFIKNFIKNA